MSDEQTTVPAPPAKVLSRTESAWQRLYPHLDRLERGDSFTDRQVCEWARLKVPIADGGDTPLPKDYRDASKFLHSKIYDHFRNYRRFEITRPRNTGTFQIHDAETVDGVVYARRVRRATKDAKTTLSTATNFDHTELPPERAAELAHRVRWTGQQLDVLKQTEKEIKRGTTGAAALLGTREHASCPQCRAKVPAKADVCPSCGYQYRPKDED
jgi:rubrerythrin